MKNNYFDDDDEEGTSPLVAMYVFLSAFGTFWLAIGILIGILIS